MEHTVHGATKKAQDGIRLDNSLRQDYAQASRNKRGKVNEGDTRREGERGSFEPRIGTMEAG